MSTSASSLNWWYMLGSFCLMKSAGRLEAMSRKTPPCGVPRPSSISLTIAFDTTSRVSSSGGRRFFIRSPVTQASASCSVAAKSPLNISGM